MTYNENREISYLSDEIDKNQIPEIINEQFDIMQLLHQKVSMATDKAEAARNSAQAASEKPAGIFQKKKAIEAIQSAQIDLADAQAVAAEAQEVSFNYQKKLGEIATYLFDLGTRNIAMNNAVVREIEMRLRGASEEELDEFAKKELMEVLRKLKAQEDFMKKQRDLSQQVKKHDRLLESISQKETEQDAELERQASVDEEFNQFLNNLEAANQQQDKELARQAETDLLHEKKIAEGFAKDTVQDSELKRQADKDKEHDLLLARIAQINNDQDSRLAHQAKMAEERAVELAKLQELGRVQDQQISELLAVKSKQDLLIEAIIKTNESQEQKLASLEQRCVELEKQLEGQSAVQTDNNTSLSYAVEKKLNKNTGLVSLIIGIAALVMGIIQFFI